MQLGCSPRDDQARVLEEAVKALKSVQERVSILSSTSHSPAPGHGTIPCSAAPPVSNITLHYGDESMTSMLFPSDSTWDFVSAPLTSTAPFVNLPNPGPGINPPAMQALQQAQNPLNQTPLRVLAGSQFLPKNVGFLIMTNTMVIVDANEALAQQLGLPLDQVIGAAIPDISIRDPTPEFTQPVLELLMGERSMLGTVSKIELKHSDRKIWVRTHLVEIKSDMTEVGLRHFFGMLQFLDTPPARGSRLLQ